ncbi:MAG: membrane protein insertase YidC [Flavobacteriales bacterium]|jgi:YidC/Oxa1 family membrane protein insertase|nr:membrane protein insertase YidC [Flavobacteriales bacterium]
MLNNQNKGFDKSSIVGMVLIGVILIWMQYAFSDDQEKENPKDKTEQTQEANTSKTVENKAEESVSSTPFALVDSNGQTVAQESTIYTLENEKVKIEIDSKGGRVVSAYLKEYTTWEEKPVNLIHKDKSAFDLVYAQQGKKVHTQDMYFQAQEQKTDDAQILALSYKDATGATVYFKYSLKKDDYRLAFQISSTGLENQLTMDSQAKLNFQIDAPRQEKSVSNERNYSSVYYNETGEGVDELSMSSSDEETIESVDWIAFKDQFFATIFEPNSSIKNAQLATVRYEDEETNYVRKMSLAYALPIKRELNYDFNLYFVPNHYKTLNDYKKDFHYLVDLGWGIFGWINRFVVIELFHLLEGWNLGYGIIIFIMALVIKLALFPFTKKSYTSAAAMRVLKPQLDKIKEQYPDDQMKQQQEQMALYGKAGVSPLSGCLPLLVQMPILFALFRFFPASIELRHESFLWADDLSTYDVIANLPFEIPFYGAHISLFALLMAGSSFLQMIYNQQTSSMGDNEQAKMMKNMMYFMPIIFLGVMNSYASGLSYYYLIANLMTFGQQWWIRKNTNDAKILAKIEANKAKRSNGEGGGGNRFQRRMEDMLKQQQDMKNKK